MSEKGYSSAVARRLFLSRLGAGVGVLGATAVGVSAEAAQTAPASPFVSARHSQDDWYDKVSGVHRLVFDTTSPDGLGTGLQFATNFFEANKTGYDLKDNDVAVIMIVRHKSTAFGYNDAIWAKYSAQLSQNTGFVDPQSKEAPVVNFYGTPGKEGGRPGRLAALINRGAHVAICQMATRAIAGQLARATNQTQDDVFAELAANLVTNGHLAAAGILALNRAQEHGYTVAHAG